MSEVGGRSESIFGEVIKVRLRSKPKGFFEWLISGIWPLIPEFE
jgi:hypothetical protein